MDYGRHDRAMDRYITGNWGEDQFRDNEPIDDEDSICANGNACDNPNCPEHGDDEDKSITDAESEGWYVPPQEEK